MISMDISRMFASLQKLCAALGLMAFLMSAAPISASDAPQQRWVGDLPIMDGMTIEPELGFAFDSPGGRIVLVFVASDAETGNVMAFYNAALASLGWDGSDGNWSRRSESLSLSQVETSGGRLWRIRLSPN